MLAMPAANTKLTKPFLALSASGPWLVIPVSIKVRSCAAYSMSSGPTHTSRPLRRLFHALLALVYES